MEETLEQQNRLLADLEQKVETVRAEREEVRTALKVSMKLWLASNLRDDRPEEGEIAPSQSLPEAKGLTVGQAALMVLHEGNAEGMTSGDILEAVRARYFPDLVRTSLSPPLSRLKTRGEVELNGDRWKVAQEKEPPSESSPGGPFTGDA